MANARLLRQAQISSRTHFLHHIPPDALARARALRVELDGVFILLDAALDYVAERLLRSSPLERVMVSNGNARLRASCAASNGLRRTGEAA